GVAAGGAGTRSSGGTRVGPLAFRPRTATTTSIVAPTSTAPRPSMTSADADKGSCLAAHRTPCQLTLRNNCHPERDADADRSERSAPLPEGAEDCRPCSPGPPCPSRRGSSGRDPEAGRDELPVVAAPFAGLSVCRGGAISEGGMVGTSAVRSPPGRSTGRAPGFCSAPPLFA